MRNRKAFCANRKLQRLWFSATATHQQLLQREEVLLGGLVQVLAEERHPLAGVLLHGVGERHQVQPDVAFVLRENARARV